MSLESAPLPPGWSQHTAPTGHTFYYNEGTNTSTYAHPSLPGFDPSNLPPPPPGPPPAADPFVASDGFVSFGPNGAHHPRPDRISHRPPTHVSDRRPRQPQDRPKTRHEIPNCAPWVLVKTRLRRRFVHNPETGESFWKVPEDLVQGVVGYDVREGKRAEGTLDEYLKAIDTREEQLGPNPLEGQHEKPAAEEEEEEVDDGDAASSDEYEEVEVTDDEDASSDPANKRLRREPEPEEQAQDQPHEFNEDDMAYQLAQMGQDYALDPGEYGDEAYPEEDYEGEDMAQDPMDEEHGLAMTAEEATAAFHDALTDHAISPYTTWDHIISSDSSPLLSDARYTLLTTTKDRRAAFDTWSTQRIAQLKALEADKWKMRAKQHPRVKYLELLSEHATPKLYWPEFRRKYKREAVMQDRGLSDKEREKLYREYITRVTKKSERERIRDLRELLRSVPCSDEWSQGMDTQKALAEDGGLPETVTSDLRWAVLGRREREDVLKVFVEDLPVRYGDPVRNVEANDRNGEAKADRAIRYRQTQFCADRQRQQVDLRKGHGELAHAGDELRRAMR